MLLTLSLLMQSTPMEPDLVFFKMRFHFFLNYKDCNFTFHFIFEGIGVVDPSGHIDMYPNGGQYQPGCLITSFSYFFPSSWTLSANQFVTSVIQDNTDVFCSHVRVLDLFNDSLLPNTCQYVAYQCSSYSDFQQVHIFLLTDVF